jgi:hypothetical protein
MMDRELKLPATGDCVRANLRLVMNTECNEERKYFEKIYNIIISMDGMLV